jgi:Cys-rich protein (TIGR01571 family)
MKEIACKTGGDCDDGDVHPLLAAFGVIMAIAAVLPFIACGGIIAQLIFMCQYKSNVTDRRPPLQPGAGAAQLSASGDFASGLFSCFDDCPTCLHAYFCGPCRAGDTYQSADIMQYWYVIGLFWVANIVAGVITSMVNGLVNMMLPREKHVTVVHDEMTTTEVTTETPHPAVLPINIIVGTIVGALVLGGIFQKFRRQLRVKLGKTEEDQPNIVMDIILFGLFTCCAVSQEARAYDAATGVKVACCCNLTDVAGQPLNVQAQPLVGQPVPVQGRVM